jgi:hypothetical protein
VSDAGVTVRDCDDVGRWYVNDVGQNSAERLRCNTQDLTSRHIVPALVGLPRIIKVEITYSSGA